MAEITRSELTLMELAKRTYNQEFMLIAENLSERNRIVEDAIWVESNDFTSHTFPKRTSEPTGSWTQINEGVAPETSTVNQVTETIGMLEGWSTIDLRLLKLSKNRREFRFGEDKSFIQGMSKTLSNAVIFGNQVATPGQFDGLATRFNALSLANVIGNGGTGSDLSSIWVVRWNESDGVHLVYPRDASDVGISAEDLGEDVDVDSTGKKRRVVHTHFMVSVGMAVRDDRSVFRIANVEQPGNGPTGEFDEDKLIEAFNEMWDLDGTVVYTNRKIKTGIDIAAKDKTNAYYTVDTVFGKPTTHIQGIPIKLVEQITQTEAAVA